MNKKIAANRARKFWVMHFYIKSVLLGPRYNIFFKIARGNQLLCKKL